MAGDEVGVRAGGHRAGEGVSAQSAASFCAVFLQGEPGRNEAGGRPWPLEHRHDADISDDELQGA